MGKVGTRFGSSFLIRANLVRSRWDLRGCTTQCLWLQINQHICDLHSYRPTRIGPQYGSCLATILNFTEVVKFDDNRAVASVTWRIFKFLRSICALTRRAAIPWTSQLRTSQPSIVAIQLGHISHLLQMINTAARLVRAHLDFCTSWRQTQSFFAVLKAWHVSPLYIVL